MVENHLTLGVSWNETQLAPLGKFKAWWASYTEFQVAPHTRTSADKILMSTPARFIK